MRLLGLTLLYVVCVVLQALTLPAGKRIAVLQSKGGGHGEIGYALSKLLQETNDVTLLQDPACNDDAEPFCSYGSALTRTTVVRMPLEDAAAVAAMLSGRWDCVVDNNTKDSMFATALSAQMKGRCEQLLYISSGGMYYDCVAGGCKEDGCCPVKEDNACRQVEIAFSKGALGDCCAHFRPQYIYGGNTNKRSNLDWFLDRIAVGAPVPLPGDGRQEVALTHVDDVVALLAIAVGHPEASRSAIFNCGTQVLHTYQQVAQAVAKAVGKVPHFAYYDPTALDKVLGKPTFPFRPYTFVLNPTKARDVLGWPGANRRLQDELPSWIEQHSRQDKVAFVGEDAAVAALI